MSTYNIIRGGLGCTACALSLVWLSSCGAKHDAEMSALVAKHDAEMSALVAKHKAEISALVAKFDAAGPLIPLPFHGPISKTPILASGGSMTFRAMSGWNCDPHGSNLKTSCTLSGTFSPAVSDDLPDWPTDPTGKNAEFQTTSKWKITFTPYSNAAHPYSPAVSVILCASANGSSCIADLPSGAPTPTPKRVLLYAKNLPASGGVGFVLRQADEDGTTPNVVVQYYDQACLVHGSAASPTVDSPPAPIPACEHPQNVTFTGLTTLASSSDPNAKYQCTDGICRVYIGELP